MTYQEIKFWIVFIFILFTVDKWVCDFIDHIVGKRQCEFCKEETR